MLEPEEVSAMLRLNELGWGTKRIARELGISRNTVRTTSRHAAGRHIDNRSARRRSMARRLGCGNACVRIEMLLPEGTGGTETITLFFSSSTVPPPRRALSVPQTTSRRSRYAERKTQARDPNRPATGDRRSSIWNYP